MTPVEARSMTPEEERCAEAKKLERIDEAFRSGDLEALRAAVDDPSVLPNGHIHDTIGTPLVYAIYRSPLAFIQALLELGADPNAPADDGFPPLIAALSCTREEPGATKRTDVDRVLRLLLAHGADPNQRGINDYTPLHMAVGERNGLAVQILLDGGADPDLRTRIDDYDTPAEMARSAALSTIAEMLARRGRPLNRRLRSGLTLLVDVPGEGDAVGRQRNYLVQLRIWLKRGEPVRWPSAWGPVGTARLEDDGETLVTEVRTNRGQMISGLFYGMEGMRVGGMRRLEIAPHLAFGERGVPGVIPPNAVLTAEVTVLSAR
jgi:hypothetical protein